MFAASANERADSSQLISEKSKKLKPEPQPLVETSQVTSNCSTAAKDSGQSNSVPISINAGANSAHQSAFKVFSRSNNQKSSMFYVSQVTEDTLNKSKVQDTETLAQGKSSDTT